MFKHLKAEISKHDRRQNEVCVVYTSLVTHAVTKLKHLSLLL